jgi:hypothetical protein
MFRPRDQKEPEILRECQVSLAQGVGVKQRRSLLPVLGPGVRLDDLGVECIATEQGPVRSRQRVSDCGVGQHAVEDAPPCKVSVHPQFEEVTQKATALGNANAQSLARSRAGATPQWVCISKCIGGVVSQERNQVAHRCEADPKHRRASSAVPEIVERSHFKGAVMQRDVLSIDPRPGPRRQQLRYIALPPPHP